MASTCRKKAEKAKGAINLLESSEQFIADKKLSIIMHAPCLIMTMRCLAEEGK